MSFFTYPRVLWLALSCAIAIVSPFVVFNMMNRCSGNDTPAFGSAEWQDDVLRPNASVLTDFVARNRLADKSVKLVPPEIDGYTFHSVERTSMGFIFYIWHSKEYDDYGLFVPFDDVTFDFKKQNPLWPDMYEGAILRPTSAKGVYVFAIPR